MQTFKYMMGMFGKGACAIAAVLLAAALLTYGRTACLFMATELAGVGAPGVLLDSLLVVFAVGMWLLEKNILAWVAEAEFYRNDDRKDHMRYMVQTVTLHNFGIAGTCAFVMIYRTPQLYLNAVGLVCIALLSFATVQNLHCLYGKTGKLTNRKSKTSAKPGVAA